MPFLCAHFREKLTVDGEQVYFAVSKNGFDWESVNSGRPILESNLGTGGCRDIEIVRKKEGGFVILTTDLCVVKRMDENHNIDWRDINHNGSKNLCFWQTDNLVDFSEQELLYFGRDDFGCLWAPEVTFDDKNGDYVIHWGSTVKEDGFEHMSIYYTRTKDFKSFTYPEMLFTKDNEILDSHIVKFGGKYYFFYKNAHDPSGNMLQTCDEITGPYTNDEGFFDRMKYYTNAGAYEGATSYVLPDGRWCLWLDFFGCPKEQMGYVPYVSGKPGDTFFKRADSEFTFPYGFKHGRVIEISDEEYERVVNAYSK